MKLLERIKHTKRYFLLCPEIRSVPEHIEQCFARFAVELWCIWQLLEYHEETELLSGLIHQACQAVGKRIVVLAEMAWKVKGFGNGR